MIERRTALTLLAGSAAAVACPICLAPSVRAAESQAHWGYEGHEGPANWAELSEDYAVCGAGAEQSPIDLTGRVPAVLSDLSVDWRDTKLAVVNNGHTIQVNIDPGSKIALQGKAFDLKQFHFHHRSEHTVEGQSYDMEIHFVHAAADQPVVLSLRRFAHDTALLGGCDLDCLCRPDHPVAGADRRLRGALPGERTSRASPEPALSARQLLNRRTERAAQLFTLGLQLSRSVTCVRATARRLGSR